MAIGFGIAAPKGETRKKTKGRADRAEAKVKKSVRAECVARDGYCRIGSLNRSIEDQFDERLFVPALCDGCEGPSEWAHLESTRRSRTRKMRPELRHHTAGTMMLCRFHHDQLDGRMRPRLRITFLTNLGADCAVEFS